jgi:hypothetical protein
LRRKRGGRNEVFGFQEESHKGSQTD